MQYMRLVMYSTCEIVLYLEQVVVRPVKLANCSNTCKTIQGIAGKFKAILGFMAK